MRSDAEERACELARTYYGDVYAYCRRRSATPEDAQDLAQETFLRFVRAQRTRRYRDAGKPLAYLLSIARNVCIDASRKRRFDQVPFDEAAHDFSDPAAGAGASSAVSAALLRLDPDEREILELRFDQGLGVGELAAVLGVSRFSASRRIKRALSDLKAILREADI